MDSFNKKRQEELVKQKRQEELVKMDTFVRKKQEEQRQEQKRQEQKRQEEQSQEEQRQEEQRMMRVEEANATECLQCSYTTFGADSGAGSGAGSSAGNEVLRKHCRDCRKKYNL